MIGKLTGRFGGTTPEGLGIIEVGGVGYAVRLPLPTMLTLESGAVNELSLFIHTAVREDAIDLYGFLTIEELSFFKQLMSVSGIGPKTALGVLNMAEVATLKSAIAAGDTVKLIKVFGIGKKSAERMVVELRDKLGAEVGVGAPSGEGEVLEALMALGYSASEARAALKAASKTITPDASVKEKLAAALKYVGPTLHTS
ncbi:MAG: Holliday junction branch migration protein RuvA [Patescibacteria group bacterium]